jgi:hypothetical protein
MRFLQYHIILAFLMNWFKQKLDFTPNKSDASNTAYSQTVLNSSIKQQRFLIK